MPERSGTCLPGKIWSRTNVVHLHFYTDEYGTWTGWSANWTASTPTGDHFVKNNFHFINKSMKTFIKRIDVNPIMAMIIIIMIMIMIMIMICDYWTASMPAVDNLLETNFI